MWQLAVAAAVAGGSGFLAKHLFSHPNSNNPHNQIDPEQHTQQDQTLEDCGVSDYNSTNSLISSPHFAQTLLAHNHETAISEQEQVDAVFRFSSSGSPLDSKKTRVSGMKKKNASRVIRKRRNTSRVSKESDSACSKDQSAFGWGFGLGLMYMMSVGKAEVSKLSHAIDDTANAVRELKSEFHKNKPSQFLGNVDVTTTNTTPKLMTKKADIEPSTSNKHSIINTKVITHSAHSEYASSVLTEEYQPGGEMDQLEAELESELQKLPWCNNEISKDEGNITNAAEIERRGSMSEGVVTYQSGGVSPTELKNKPSHLLLKQQEGHITELESELNLAYSKLQEKEDELRTLKDCVKRLTEFSLSTASADEETEAIASKEESVDKKRGSENAVVGMRRCVGFGICD